MKSEWGQSKNPSLVTRPRPKTREEPIPLNKRPKMEEGRASGGEETPRRKRFRSTSPVITEGVKPQPVHTGASTPVGVKVKRIQSKIDRDRSQTNKSIGQQIQPTLRSFLDLRGGLVGPKSGATKKETSKDGSKDETG